MAGIHALDRLIGNEYPELATDAEVRAFEQVPYADRVAAESTFDAIRLGAARNPDGAAIQFLQNAIPANKPFVVPYVDSFAPPPRPATCFNGLGRKKAMLVILFLHLVPNALVPLLYAQAA